MIEPSQSALVASDDVEERLFSAGCAEPVGTDPRVGGRCLAALAPLVDVGAQPNWHIDHHARIKFGAAIRAALMTLKSRADEVDGLRAAAEIVSETLAALDGV